MSRVSFQSLLNVQIFLIKITINKVSNCFSFQFSFRLNFPLFRKFLFLSDLSLHWSTFTWRMIALCRVRLALEKSVFVFIREKTSQWSEQFPRAEAGWIERRFSRCRVETQEESGTTNRIEINSQKTWILRFIFWGFVSFFVLANCIPFSSLYCLAKNECLGLNCEVFNEQ